MSAVPFARTAFGQAGAPSGGAEPLLVTRGGNEPSQAPAENFTGSVRVDTRFRGTGPARVGGARVTFQPGARTAWHTHPLGQTLIVTDGRGWVQRDGGPIEEVRAGDVAWIPAGARHWHGATPTTAMSHVAVAEAQGGQSVTWMEQVTDEQYRRGPPPTSRAR